MVTRPTNKNRELGENNTLDKDQRDFWVTLRVTRLSKFGRRAPSVAAKAKEIPIMVDVGNFSDGGIKKLHDAVLDALDKDDKTPPNQDKPYGVRQFPDWRQWSDALEAELQKRKIPFSKVKW
ncbi:MAG: hypothetical protein ABSG30_12465 [Steroidobacteraceae bacterium]